jgi:hypothetical protein
MNVKKFVLVVAVSASLGVGIGLVVRKAIATHVPRGAVASSVTGQALGPSSRPAISSGFVDPAPVPPPPKGTPKGVSADGHWAAATGPDGKKVWARTQESVQAQRMLSVKTFLENRRAKERAAMSGTHIVLTDEDPVGDPKIRKAIAAAFAQLDPLPPSRQAHFAWTAQYNFEIIGWSGVIMGLEQTPQGWVVDVRFHAIFTKGNVAVLPHTERWLLDGNGNLTMLGAPRNQRTGIGGLKIN